MTKPPKTTEPPVRLTATEMAKKPGSALNEAVRGKTVIVTRNGVEIAVVIGWNEYKDQLK